MTTELTGVVVVWVAVGVDLGGVTLTSLRGIREELKYLRGEIRGFRREVGGPRGELNEFRRDMEMRLSAVERQQAKLEGLLEGLREAITGHKAA